MPGVFGLAQDTLSSSTGEEDKQTGEDRSGVLWSSVAGGWNMTGGT